MTARVARHDFIRTQTEELIARVLGLDAEEVHPGAHLREDLGLSSYDLADLLVEMESHFAIHISDDFLEDMVTVEDIVGIARATAARGRSGASTPRHLADLRRAGPAAAPAGAGPRGRARNEQCATLTPLGADRRR